MDAGHGHFSGCAGLANLPAYRLLGLDGNPDSYSNAEPGFPILYCVCGLAGGQSRGAE